MKNQINQQREVSSCCGAEVLKCELCNNNPLLCTGCQKHCELAPVEPRNENPYPTGNLSPVQPTPEETRQTGSEGWEDRFDEFSTGKTWEADGMVVLASPAEIKQFIRDLLAAKEEEMEQQNKNNEITSPCCRAKLWRISSNGYECSTCAEKIWVAKASYVNFPPDPSWHQKKIIEAVEKRERELRDEFTQLKIMHEMEKNAIAVKTLEQFVVWSDERKKLNKAEFKREYGEK